MASHMLFYPRIVSLFRWAHRSSHEVTIHHILQIAFELAFTRAATESSKKESKEKK